MPDLSEGPVLSLHAPHFQAKDPFCLIIPFWASLSVYDDRAILCIKLFSTGKQAVRAENKIRGEPTCLDSFGTPPKGITAGNPPPKRRRFQAVKYGKLHPLASIVKVSSSANGTRLSIAGISTLNKQYPLRHWR